MTLKRITTAMLESNHLASPSSMLFFLYGTPCMLNHPYRLVCELRDHTGRALATTTLLRTWGGDKPSRRAKKDTNRRSGHHVNPSGELATPHTGNHALPISHAHLPSLSSEKPRSHVPPIKVEASSPAPVTPSRVD